MLGRSRDGTGKSPPPVSAGLLILRVVCSDVDQRLSSDHRAVESLSDAVQRELERDLVVQALLDECNVAK